MMSYLQRMVSIRTGLCLAIASFLFIGGWRLGVIACRPAHLLSVATEIGSIAQSKEAPMVEELVPGNDGTGLVFFQETETGLGTYFCETASGKIRLLFEQKEKGYNPKFGMLGWSPDDRSFACDVISGPDPLHPNNEIILYNGTSGEPIVKIAANGYLPDSKFVWLSPHSFAFTTYNQAWLVFEQKPDANWVQTQVVKKFAEEELKNLSATVPNSVAWQNGDEIWTYDFASGSSEKMWESSTNKLESFDYSRETGNFLLNCRDENGPLSICFRPHRLWEKEGAIVSVTRNDIPAKNADLSIDHGLYSFTIKTGTNSEPRHFTWDGMVEYYKLGGDYLYFTGGPANEPPGIWEYDMQSKAARRLASGLQRGLKYTKMVTPIAGTATNASGKQMSYHVWEPIHVASGKKYPLIIGQTHYMWFSYQQVAANEGCYFASADRSSWWDGLSDWGEDVKGLYSVLAKNPNIDTNRVFLFATSAESGYLSAFVGSEPDLCKGVILFNPVSTPDLQNTHLSKMFIASGIDDGNAVQRLTRYQDEAARAGVTVKLIFQDGVQHITRSIATERERTRQFARFLAEN